MMPEFLQRIAFAQHKLLIEFKLNNASATLGLLRLLAPIRRFFDRRKG